MKLRHLPTEEPHHPATKTVPLEKEPTPATADAPHKRHNHKSLKRVKTPSRKRSGEIPKESNCINRPRLPQGFASTTQPTPPAHPGYRRPSIHARTASKGSPSPRTALAPSEKEHRAAHRQCALASSQKSPFFCLYSFLFRQISQMSHHIRRPNTMEGYADNEIES